MFKSMWIYALFTGLLLTIGSIRENNNYLAIEDYPVEANMKEAVYIGDVAIEQFVIGKGADARKR